MAADAREGFPLVVTVRTPAHESLAAVGLAPGVIRSVDFQHVVEAIVDVVPAAEPGRIADLESGDQVPFGQRFTDIEVMIAIVADGSPTTVVVIRSIEHDRHGLHTEVRVGDAAGDDSGGESGWTRSGRRRRYGLSRITILKEDRKGIVAAEAAHIAGLEVGWGWILKRSRRRLIGHAVRDEGSC